VSALAPALRLRTYTKRTFIFHEGDPGNVLYVVVRGQVKIGRIGRGGNEVVFAILSPGETFGELPLFEVGAIRAPTRRTTPAGRVSNFT